MKAAPFLASVAAILGLAAVAWADEPDDKYGFATGKTMPFFVVDFVNGKNKGHGGCPGVMVSNAQARGVILLVRETNDSVWALTKALDAKAVDGSKVHGYLVVMIADAEGLTASTEKADLAKFNVAIPRSVAKSYFKTMGLADRVLVNVLLTDRKDVKASFLLTAEELTPEKQREIVAAAEKFAGK